MNRHHAVAPTTHTLVLDQLRDVNRRLDAPHDSGSVTAKALGIWPESLAPAQPLWPGFGSDASLAVPAARPDRLVVEHVWAEGSPLCPYIWARLSPVGVAAAVKSPVVSTMMDVDAMSRLSRALGLRQQWTII